MAKEVIGEKLLYVEKLDMNGCRLIAEFIALNYCVAQGVIDGVWSAKGLSNAKCIWG